MFNGKKLCSVAVASLASMTLLVGGASPADAAPPFSCSVGSSGLLEGIMDGSAGTWSGSCTYVAPFLNDGALSVSTSPSGSVNATVICTLGSASRDSSGTTTFSRIGHCVLTAYGSGAGSAGAS